MDIRKIRREGSLRRVLALTAGLVAVAATIEGTTNKHNYMPTVYAAGADYKTNGGPNLLYGLAGLLGAYSLGSHRRARDAQRRLEQAEREAYEKCELA